MKRAQGWCSGTRGHKSPGTWNHVPCVHWLGRLSCAAAGPIAGLLPCPGPRGSVPAGGKVVAGWTS